MAWIEGFRVGGRAAAAPWKAENLRPLGLISSGAIGPDTTNWFSSSPGDGNQGRQRAGSRSKPDWNMFFGLMHPAIPLLVLALATTEGLAWWWMHPTPKGGGQVVLFYSPRLLSHEADLDPRASRSPSPSRSPGDSAINSITPLPDLYRKVSPMLRCTDGRIFHVSRKDSTSLHLAFFEWEGTDPGSVLEAFRHMPEDCLGSIGMKFVSREAPVRYQMGGETLVFDHTVFGESVRRDPAPFGGPKVHSFRAVWVGGSGDAGLRQKLFGNDLDRLRAIRLESALTRFRPQHARVIQGAVRGAPNGAAAWLAFQETILNDLRFEPAE